MEHREVDLSSLQSTKLAEEGLNVYNFIILFIYLPLFILSVLVPLCLSAHPQASAPSS